MTIRAEHLEIAERKLAVSHRLMPNQPRVILDAARINRLAGDRFLEHHKRVLFQTYMPDIDPRYEAPLMTMMLHMLAVGAVAQRISEGGAS